MNTSDKPKSSQVTPLGALRSGRELLMSKATDADVTVAGLALAMAATWWKQWTLELWCIFPERTWDANPDMQSNGWIQMICQSTQEHIMCIISCNINVDRHHCNIHACNIVVIRSDGKSHRKQIFWGLAPIRQVRRSNRKSHAGLPEVLLLSKVSWRFFHVFYQTVSWASWTSSHHAWIESLYMSWCHNLLEFWLWWTPVPWNLSCKDREDNDEILWPWWYMRNCFGCINRFQRDSSKRCFTLKKWPVVMLRVSVEAGAKRQVQGGAWWSGEREEMEFWLSFCDQWWRVEDIAKWLHRNRLARKSPGYSRDIQFLMVAFCI